MGFVEDRLITVTEAAELTGKSARWVQKLADDGWIERAERGRYSMAGVIRGATGYAAAQALAKGGADVAVEFVRDRLAYDRQVAELHRAAHRRMIAAARKELATLGADAATVRAAVARIEAAGKGKG
jgi:hypothetical protein